ncbi:MAG TPA: hypothetical protein VNM14_13045 [Planctomycetota bacterium]|jgi:hypothetical protein|nr:hypothetical protein [Planctomycetota bacterium]
MWEALRFAVWAGAILFVGDFVYAAFHQGRHLNQALRWRPKKRNR